MNSNDVAKSLRMSIRRQGRWFAISSLLLCCGVAGGIVAASTPSASVLSGSEGVGAQVQKRAPQPADASGTARLSGRVQLTNRNGTKPARSVSAEDVVVFYTPNETPESRTEDQKTRSPSSRASAKVALPTETLAKAVMETRNKAFAPRVLTVAKGEDVAFPNRDRILHNVFSVSGKNQFDLDLYGAGESRDHSFDHTGLVRVFCNVHRDMVGYVWVLDTPHSTSADAEGRFELLGLPLGTGTLTVWHERAEPLEVEIQVTGVEVDELIDLAITRPRLPSHSRKDGGSYRQRETYN